MCERKAWTKEDDQLLLSIMNNRESLTLPHPPKWNTVAQRMTDLGCKTQRTGKQCRERWFNQLHPSLARELPWTPEEESLLFKLQLEEGNHWASIARQLPGRSDNNIKNYFYSSLRKALRKVNNYVNYNKAEEAYKNLKPFPNSTLTKLMAVAQHKSDNKIHIAKEEATDLAKQIKNLLVQIQLLSNSQPPQPHSHLLPLAAKQIQSFNRICKRKKLKKKHQTKNTKDHFKVHLKLSPENRSPQSQAQQSQPDSESQDSQNQADVGQVNKIEEQYNKPMQRSQPIVISREASSLTFPSTLSLGQSPKMRHTLIIPSSQYNCAPSQTSFSLKNQHIKSSLQTDQSFRFEQRVTQLNRGLLPLIPVAFPASYHGSAFMPTLSSPSQIMSSAQYNLLKRRESECRVGGLLQGDGKGKEGQKKQYQL